MARLIIYGWNVAVVIIYGSPAHRACFCARSVAGSEQENMQGSGLWGLSTTRKWRHWILDLLFP